MRKLFNSFGLAIAVIVAILGLQFMGVVSPHDQELLAQIGQVFPNVTANVASAGTNSVRVTAGTLNNGGHSVTVTASSVALVVGRGACTAPDFTACNIVYANSSGTVAVTSASNALAVANRSGNSVLAYVETNTTGNGVITRIAYPTQSSVAPMMPAILTECLASASCAAPVTGAAVKVAAGSATLSAGTVTITGIAPAFQYDASTLQPGYTCMAFFNATTTTAAQQTVRCTPISGTSFSITVGVSASATDIMRWVLIGQ